MLKLFNLDRDGCQHFSQIFDEDIINELSVAVDSFLGVEKIFNKIYHDPFYIGDHYAMIFSSQLEGSTGSNPKKSIIVINGNKCNKIMKISFAILYPEFLFKDEIDEIIKIDLIYLLLQKITKKRWYLDNAHISIQVGCNDNIKYDRKTDNKEIKMFIPLDNINRLEDGPMVYIRYSHKMKNLPNEFPCIMYPMKKGDFVLYYQNGLQKIGPQVSQKIRKILILTFRILQ
jgi:hypothetical protein